MLPAFSVVPGVRNDICSANLTLSLVIQTHSSSGDEAFDRFGPYAGAGLGPSPPISRAEQMPGRPRPRRHDRYILADARRSLRTHRQFAR